MGSEPDPDLEQLRGLLRQEGASQGELTLALYEELRKVAAKQMRRQSPGHTLQPTALVGEFFARLQALHSTPEWPTKAHFFKWTARVMSNLLKDYARHKNSQKAGGQRLRLSLHDCDLPVTDDSHDATLDLMEAIDALANIDAKLANVIRLQALVGLSYLEIAETLGMSESQVDRALRAARSWLRDHLDQ